MDESELARAVHYSNGRDAGYEAGLKRALELIGKEELVPDVELWNKISSDFANGHLEGQNALRAELRTRISKELEGDNNEG